MARTWKSVLIHRIMDTELERCARAYLRGRLIDIGCGTKPYERMLGRYVSEYVGVDRLQPFNEMSRPNLVGTAYQIPAEDESFDAALSTATLEHLAEPESALRECYRVLKDGGIAIYTAPLIWHLHSEPWDYFRFTRYGLEHIFQKAGFELIEVRPLAGFWETAATMICYYMDRFNKRPLRYIGLIPAVGLFVQGLGGLLGKLDKAPEWTWMYMVVARKK